MNEAGYSREGTLFSSKIVCKKCGLIILKQNVAVISYLKDVELPNHNGQKEPIEEFVMVNDVYAFENVGFLKAVGEMKFLSCADCDFGPIGFHYVNDTKRIYVALCRVLAQPV